MVSRWFRVEKLGNSLRQLPRAGDNNQRVVRHVSQFAGAKPIHVPLLPCPSACLQVRFHKQIECVPQEFVRCTFANHHGLARRGATDWLCVPELCVLMVHETTTCYCTVGRCADALPQLTH